jgi:predicted ester cyclase
MQNPTQENLNRDVVARFLNGTHGGHYDVIDETVSPSIRTHGFPGGNNPDSHATYKAFFADFNRAFADMRFDTHAMVAEGDQVAVRFHVGVTHVDDYAGVAASGARVGFDGMAIYRLDQGRIAETWLQLDALSLMQQIGALQ